MISYAIISDKDEVYQNVIDKLNKDSDYMPHKIQLDIRSDEVSQVIANQEKDIDFFCVLSKDTSKVIIKLLQNEIPFQKIITFDQIDEISKFTNIVSRIYRNGVVHYSLSNEIVPSEIKMDEVNYDYVRFRTLALVVQQIKEKKLPGAMAEVGVFRGDFSRWLNICLEDKELFLFDTFEGFDSRDINEEKLTVPVSESLENLMNTGFKNTSVEFVLKRMKNKEKCKVYKGYFPETAKGIDSTFCFVSLDTDLYRPTKEGLEFFWPRLEQGGYIFVHDYNSDERLEGVHVAVDEWSKENGVCIIPICDKFGSCIIVKNRKENG